MPLILPKSIYHPSEGFPVLVAHRRGETLKRGISVDIVQLHQFNADLDLVVEDEFSLTFLLPIIWIILESSGSQLPSYFASEIGVNYVDEANISQ